MGWRGWRGCHERGGWRAVVGQGGKGWDGGGRPRGDRRTGRCGGRGRRAPTVGACRQRTAPRDRRGGGAGGCAAAACASRLARAGGAVVGTEAGGVRRALSPPPCLAAPPRRQAPRPPPPPHTPTRTGARCGAAGGRAATAVCTGAGPRRRESRTGGGGGGETTHPCRRPAGRRGATRRGAGRCRQRRRARRRPARARATRGATPPPPRRGPMETRRPLAQREGTPGDGGGTRGVQRRGRARRMAALGGGAAQVENERQKAGKQGGGERKGNRKGGAAGWKQEVRRRARKTTHTGERGKRVGGSPHQRWQPRRPGAERLRIGTGWQGRHRHDDNEKEKRINSTRGRPRSMGREVVRVDKKAEDTAVSNPPAGSVAVEHSAPQRPNGGHSKPRATPAPPPPPSSAPLSVRAGGDTGKHGKKKQKKNRNAHARARTASRPRPGGHSAPPPHLGRHKRDRVVGAGEERGDAPPPRRLVGVPPPLLPRVGGVVGARVWRRERRRDAQRAAVGGEDGGKFL